MGYISPDAKWYLADIVQRIEVEGDPRLVVHTNVVLIRADSPDEAYTKATEIGAASEISYDNPDGKRVDIMYCGLSDLNVIHDELEHGAELTYTEKIGIDDAAIRRLIPSKEELGIFAPRRTSTGPDYKSRDVVDQMHRELPGTLET